MPKCDFNKVAKHLVLMRENTDQKTPYTGCFNPLSANPKKWSNTLKQFIGNSRQIV